MHRLYHSSLLRYRLSNKPVFFFSQSTSTCSCPTLRYSLSLSLSKCSISWSLPRLNTTEASSNSCLFHRLIWLTCIPNSADSSFCQWESKSVPFLGIEKCTSSRLKSYLCERYTHSITFLSFSIFIDEATIFKPVAMTLDINHPAVM